ncbi:hypothetical protein LX32DRAFT_646406 [Colletotrichum zoysiae]|uniref:Uncharacterized protein n=1 Tax=Colletotrichum zoysiae TaxID=1216348 RepID=A0AAD9LUA6_9PEZI|nr:hypothetical protein LX32DRAFT_646406 [Colletotrichum zoysiae]
MALPRTEDEPNQGRVCVLKPDQPPSTTTTTTKTHTLLFLLKRDEDTLPLAGVVTRFSWGQTSHPLLMEPWGRILHRFKTFSLLRAKPPVNPLPSVCTSNHMTALPIPSLQPPRQIHPGEWLPWHKLHKMLPIALSIAGPGWCDVLPKDPE